MSNIIASLKKLLFNTNLNNVKTFTIYCKKDPQIYIPEILWNYHVLCPSITEDNEGLTIVGKYLWFGRQNISIRVNY